MRMWTIDPKLLCQTHLFGEHFEIHLHRHNFVKRHSILGRVYPIVFIEPQNMKLRHDELVKEILARGKNHNSPYELPDLSHLPDNQRYAKVDLSYNLSDLFDRCSDCHKRYLDTRIPSKEAIENK